MHQVLRTFLATAVLAGFAAPAAAEVIAQDERGFVTRASSEVAATPTATWLALIAPGRWWSSSHSWSGDAANMTLMPQAGGCFCEKIPGNEISGNVTLDGSSRHMEVVQAVPPRVLRMRGGLGPLQSEPVDGVLTITLQPVDGGTKIVWEYVVGGYFRFEVPVIARAVDGVMDEQLGGLTKFLGPLVQPEPEPEPELEPDVTSEPEEAKPETADRPSVDEAFGDLSR